MLFFCFFFGVDVDLLLFSAKGARFTCVVLLSRLALESKSIVLWIYESFVFYWAACSAKKPRARVVNVDGAG